MKLRSSWPTVASTIRSIRGRGKLSLGQALLTSVKSMQSRHLLFAFLTRTTLAYQSGYFYFSDNFGLEEFVNLFIDRLLPFWGETLSFLFDRFKGGADVQLVGGYCGVNSSHILLLPGEYFYILF